MKWLGVFFACWYLWIPVTFWFGRIWSPHDLQVFGIGRIRPQKVQELRPRKSVQGPARRPGANESNRRSARQYRFCHARIIAKTPLFRPHWADVRPTHRRAAPHWADDYVLRQGGK